MESLPYVEQVLEGEAEHKNLFNGPDRVEHPYSFDLPKGVKWRVLSELELEKTYTPHTGYKLDYSPTKDNVQRVTLIVWANRDDKVFRGPLNNSAKIKIKVKVSFGPPGQVLADAFGRATVAAAASAKASASTIQSAEVTKLSNSIQRFEETSRRNALAEMEKAVTQLENGKATEEISLDKIRQAKTGYLASLDHQTFRILDLPKKWSKLYKYHEDKGLPVVDSALQSILEEKLAIIQAQKDSFETDFNSSYQDIAQHRPIVEEGRTFVPPLFGTYCLFQSDPMTACSNSDYYRFYGHYFCKEPSKDTKEDSLEMVANYDSWISNFEGRKYTGNCSPFSLDRDELPTIVADRPPLAPRPARPQQLPEFHQSMASDAGALSQSRPGQSTHSLHWARQFYKSSAGSAANNLNQHHLPLQFSGSRAGKNDAVGLTLPHGQAVELDSNLYSMHPLTMSDQQQMRQNVNVLQMQQGRTASSMLNFNLMHSFAMNGQQQMRQNACIQQMAHNQQLYQMQQAQCQLQMNQAQAFQQVQCMQQSECMQQMQQAQAINQMQCVQQMQQAQCMQQMQGGTPFTGFCTPSQLANPTGIIFPPMNAFGGYY